MEPRLYIRFSDLFDREPSLSDLITSLKDIPVRHALYALSTINLCLRIAMQDPNQDFGKVQERVLVGHLDDECLDRLRHRFPHEQVSDRPVFLPETVLHVMRLVVLHGNLIPLPNIGEDEQIRYRIGRACLMSNSLLVSPQQVDAIQSGPVDDRRIELMTQWLPSFELANPPKADHVLPRLEIMYSTLLRTPEVKARIAQCADGLDFEAEFATHLGVTLQHWLFISLTLYSYFFGVGSALEPNPSFMLINPSIFRGESGITQKELERVLAIVSASPIELRQQIAAMTHTDARYDSVEFRSYPFIQLEPEKLAPTDLTFVLDKCHTGVQWALHDQLPPKKRQSLFNAWGTLFEEYVHWLFGGMKTSLPILYFPRPLWEDDQQESFDGAFLKNTVLTAIECKGGFIKREARYSGNSAVFLADLDKKIAPGCEQLARKIGYAFAPEEQNRRKLSDFDCTPIRAVLPILAVQDHILRVPFVNWYLQRKFAASMRIRPLRPGVLVHPLTVLNVHDLESIVHSVESMDFDFVYALQNRTIRDPEGLSDVSEWLSTFPEFGRKPSPRIAAVLDRITEQLGSFLFPGLSI